MSNQRFSPEFKDEAVRQIVDRGYSFCLPVFGECEFIDLNHSVLLDYVLN